MIPSFFWLNTYYVPEKTANRFKLTPVVEVDGKMVYVGH